jgi:hypothetical protein
MPTQIIRLTRLTAFKLTLRSAIDLMMAEMVMETTSVTTTAVCRELRRRVLIRGVEARVELRSAQTRHVLVKENRILSREML